MVQISKKYNNLVAQRATIENKFTLKGTEVTSTASELNILDGVTATTAELNTLTNAVAGASFTVGTEAGNAINVAVQFNDADGTAMATACAVPFYLADDSAGLTPSTTAPNGGIAIGTDGALIESVANLSGLAISEADGDLDITLTDSGTPTFYLVLVLPNGSLAISGAITFA